MANVKCIKKSCRKVAEKGKKKKKKKKKEKEKEKKKKKEVVILSFKVKLNCFILTFLTIKFEFDS